MSKRNETKKSKAHDDRYVGAFDDDYEISDESSAAVVDEEGTDGRKTKPTED